MLRSAEPAPLEGGREPGSSAAADLASGAHSCNLVQPGVRLQLNLYDAVRRTITYDDPASGKHYELKDGKLATMVARPRG